jgi:ankyrin repeat protein
MSKEPDKKSLELFIKHLKKKNIKLSEVKSFLHNHVLDLNECDKSGYNALHYAIKSERPEIVKLMLSIGTDEETLSIRADPNKETKDKNSNIYTSPLLLSLLYTNEENESMQIIRHLCNAGANINYKDENGSTLFLHSCEKGRTDVIKFLINKIIKDKEEGNDNNEIKDMKMLINSFSKDGGGLHFAIIGQQDEVIELLLENNIDLNIQNSYGDTALLYALKEKQMNIFKRIYDYLIDNKEITNEEKKNILNHQNNEGNTILHELSYCKSSILTNMVLKLPKEICINKDLKNKEGFDYNEVAKNVIELENNRKKHEERLKEERRKLKEELRQKKYDEEKKILDEKRKYEEAMKRQEEFGKKLIEHRGIIFMMILLIFMGLMYLLIKYASVKREKII